MKLKLISIAAIATFFLLVLGSVVLAQDEPPSPYAGMKNPFPWDDASAQGAGKEIYRGSCLGCHGIDGNSIAASDFSAADYSRALEERPDYYFWRLSEGRLDRGMPPYKSSFPEEKRWQIVTYLRSLGTAIAPAKMAAEESKPSEDKLQLDCLSCHTRVLKSHDKLGEGSKACWVCHDSRTIGTLNLFDGTKLPLADSNQLCGQCHQGRYNAWREGTHGILSGKAELEFLGDQKLKCVSCHNPHQPKIDLTKLRIPSPLPVSEPGAPLDCLSCHARILEGHDKLGEGSKACWACHYNLEMGVLHLVGGETRFPLSDYPQLCAQCHQKRYADWLEGTHGMPSGEVGVVEVHGVQRVGCISCHDPHQPQIALWGITKPHPEPDPAPPALPRELVIIVGASLLIVVSIGIVVYRRGKLP